MIDVHRHYLASPLREALESRSAPPRICETERGAMIEYGRRNGHPLLAAMTDLGLQREAMERDGIEHAVLSVGIPGLDWAAPREGVSLSRQVNDELAGLCRPDPTRLSALAVL